MRGPIDRLLIRLGAALAVLGPIVVRAGSPDAAITVVSAPTHSSLPVLPEPAPDTPPKPLKTVGPEFPFSVFPRGRVYIELVVDATGRVINPYIVRSTNPWLERPAIEAVLKWTFEPAIKDGAPVAAKVTQMLKFDPLYPAENFPWQATKAKHHEQLPEDVRWDEAPVEEGSTYPIYPRGELLAERKGYATVQFRINQYGIVTNAEIVKATAPEFGGAALASIDPWRFKPARRKGQPCSALVTMDFKFDPISGGDVPVSPGMKQVARELRRKQPRIHDVDYLDQPPKALSRRPPHYPSALRQDGRRGTAVIEYFLDKDGDAQLPQVVSASGPPFGYAAAQAVASWRFEPAVKDGHPVIARCRASFSFFAPPGPDSAGDASVIIDPP